MQVRGDDVDESSVGSFPASDPPAWTPVLGARSTETEATSHAPRESRDLHENAADPAALQDRLLRTVAEQDNASRRAARAHADAMRFAAAGLVKDLAPGLDNLRRAIAAGANADSRLDDLLSGLAATERAMLSALEQHGVGRIDPKPGAPFDPDWHEAVETVADLSARPGQSPRSCSQATGCMSGCCVLHLSVSVFPRRSKPGSGVVR